MKKLLLLIIIMLMSASLLSAGIQIRPGAGMALGLGNQEIGSDREVNDKGETTKNANLYYNPGAGMYFGGAIMIAISENIGIEAGAGMVTGAETEIDKFTGPSPIKSSSKNTSSYLPIDLTIKIMAELGALTPYAGLGPTIAISPKITMTMSDTSQWAGVDVTTEMESEVTMSSGIGLNACLGTDYKLNDLLSITFGAILRSVSVKLEKMTLTKLVVNDKDVLDTLDTRDKEIEFKEDDSDDDPSDVDSPNIEPTEVINMDSLTINLGIALKF